MLDWHSCQICYPLEIKLLLLFLRNVMVPLGWRDREPSLYCRCRRQWWRGVHLALFSLRTEFDNPDATCKLSP